MKSEVCVIQKDADEEGVGTVMAGSVAIGLHNAFKDPVDTNPFNDAASPFAADAAGSSSGNAVAGTAAGYTITVDDGEIALDVLESLSLALLIA